MYFFNRDTAVKFSSRSIEYAYLEIVNNNLINAQAIFESLDSPRARWGKAFVDILLGYIERYPTYFEIRNFLEIDLDYLLKNEKIDYVEQFLGSIELLAGINQETYKYVARVFFENKHFNIAKKYLDLSKSLFYNDPELQFLLAKYYIHFREYENASAHINECIKILPDYYPARILKNEISKYI